MRRLVVCCILTLTLACRNEPRSQTAFDGQAALGYARTQLQFGPRVPGTEGHRRTGEWIVAEMRKRADTVLVQEWTHVTVRGDSLPMRNVIARFRPGESARVLYVTHWDTRPRSDEAADSAQRQLPVPGANDGASGVALFLAIGDVLKKTPPQFGVDLLFVDGEDYGDFGKDEDVLIGSKYFADHLPAPGYRPIFGVLWDMIGDRDLQIFQEGNSVQAAPEVVLRVWRQAEDMGYSQYFVPEVGYTLIDDHMPLIAKGLRVIDVIDYNYPNAATAQGRGGYHHTSQDTMDKISSASLQIVGDVALGLVLP